MTRPAPAPILLPLGRRAGTGGWCGLGGALEERRAAAERRRVRQWAPHA